MHKSVERTIGFMQQHKLMEKEIPDAAEPDGTVNTEAGPGDPAEDQMSDEELGEMQNEKIASIRAAIAAGSYDSDELLQKAIAKMLQRIDEDSDLQ